MVANQQIYDHGLEDLKLTCDAYIENLRRQIPCEPIGPYIEEYNQKNEMSLTIDSVRGIATSKEFIDTKANMDGVSLNNYKVVEPNMIAFISDTSRRADKMSLALNKSNESYLVSSITTVIKTDKTKLFSSYLYLFFCRSEFDRYARFHSWGSARETFSLAEGQVNLYYSVAVRTFQFNNACCHCYLVKNTPATVFAPYDYLLFQRFHSSLTSG